MDDIKFW